MLAGPHTSQRLYGEAVPCLFQLLVATTIVWLVVTSHHLSLCLWGHVVLSSSFSVRSPSVSLLKGYLCLDLRPTCIVLDTFLRIFQSMISANPLPCSIMFTGSRDQDLKSLFNFLQNKLYNN